jgi:acetyl esterase/lipase
MLMACNAGADRRPGNPASASIADYLRVLDRTYMTVAGRDLRLDLHLPKSRQMPVPVVLYFHGGAWTHGSKDRPVIGLERYLAAGWAVAQPNYRLAPEHPAPAAVEDAICAFRWIAAHAGEYGLDARRVVAAGFSAGGHLALLLGMLPDSTSLAANCPSPAAHGPAAVVNFAGIADLPDLLQGVHRREWAVAWIGKGAGRESVVSAVSPLQRVGPGIAPVITVHGEVDEVVPYDQARRLHRALDEAKVPNRLVTLPQQGHSIAGEHRARALTTVMAFLREQGIRRVAARDGIEGSR